MEAVPHTSSSASTGLNRQVLSLAVPALGALIAEPLFVLADSAMVGHLGAVSLAGLSLASTILTTTVGLFVFLAYATTATTARLFGAGRRTEGLRAGVDGMWLALLLGLGAGALLGLAAPWLTVAMGADGAVAQAAVAYLRASCPGPPRVGFPRFFLSPRAGGRWRRLSVTPGLWVMVIFGIPSLSFMPTSAVSPTR